MAFWITALWAFGLTTGGVLAGTALLHLLPRLGSIGKALSKRLCAGVPLDLVVGYFTVLPLILGPIFGGWAGLLGAVLGQYAGLIGWELAHELAHWKTPGRGAILRAGNLVIGGHPIVAAGKNFAALWCTTLAVPIFAATRLAQHVAYPPLTWLLGFPKYDAGEWVNVTRHKFDGLIGHDRVWCLYCDWMTGVWSLGTEMLRNVESFWCPIRFGDPSKCANCAIDFPDVAGDWVDFKTGNATEAGELVTTLYGPTDGSAENPRAWFGHPSREPVKLTVKGAAVEEPVGVGS
jgi:hypothetical protein